MRVAAAAKAAELMVEEVCKAARAAGGRVTVASMCVRAGAGAALLLLLLPFCIIFAGNDVAHMGDRGGGGVVVIVRAQCGARAGGVQHGGAVSG